MHIYKSVFDTKLKFPAYPLKHYSIHKWNQYASLSFSKLLPCAPQSKPHLQPKFALPIVETSDISSE